MVPDRRTLEVQLQEARDRIAALDHQKREELERIRQIQALLAKDFVAPIIRNDSAPEAKVTFFRNLFFGRQDVYARRWENMRRGTSGYQPACGNEWVTGRCTKGSKPKVKCHECVYRAFLPLTDATITAHLAGVGNDGKEVVIGVYPLLSDDSCHFLALDFDKDTWEEDSLAFYQTCRSHSIPATRERSRSGRGCHVWLFFAESLPASLARRLGTMLLENTLKLRPEIGLESFDRMFPNQDKMPKGGFGNLIALPLQKKAREAGNTVFVDESGQVYPDQWLHLAGLSKLSRKQMEKILESVPDCAGTEPTLIVAEDRTMLPKEVSLELDRGIKIKDELPSALRRDLMALASFHNPEFYRRDHLRLSTYNTPRFISCVELGEGFITLPRGCLEDVESLFKGLGTSCTINDMRNSGKHIDVSFVGTLTMEQQLAVEALLLHDSGTLSAGTGFGKTVVALAILARRQVNTLILVNKKVLQEQWLERINAFLSANPAHVGQTGRSNAKLSGIIDVAMLQSLHRKGICSPLLSEYGQVIVDECHHIPARSIERVMQSFSGKYVLGLSATVARKDGHEPIIFMQCGPIRHRVDPKRQAQMRAFEHKVIVRPTQFTLPSELSVGDTTIHHLYLALLNDSHRNEMIIQDVLGAIKEKRSPLILTERREHVHWFAENLQDKVKHVIVLYGGMGAKQRRLIQEELASISDDDPRVIISTGRYLGEGFDDARLDTLFLTLPISWKGILHQYTGRLHREHAFKSEVRVYDYVDYGVPSLTRMFSKREAGYRAIGYELVYPK